MKSRVGDLKNQSGDWITDDKDKADEFNALFGSVSRIICQSSYRMLTVLYVTFLFLSTKSNLC